MTHHLLSSLRSTLSLASSRWRRSLGVHIDLLRRHLRRWRPRARAWPTPSSPVCRSVWRTWSWVAGARPPPMAVRAVMRHYCAPEGRACRWRRRRISTPTTLVPFATPSRRASPAAMWSMVTRRLEDLADRFERYSGRDVRHTARTGAAGGLSGALYALGADLVSGFDEVAQVNALATRIAEASAGHHWRRSSRRGQPRRQSSGRSVRLDQRRSARARGLRISRRRGRERIDPSLSLGPGSRLWCRDSGNAEP